MTDFETTLAEALRDEVREIAMTTDKTLATIELESRLDHADRTRRWYWAAGAVAVAAAVAAVGVVVGHVTARPALQPPAVHTPAPPTPSTFSSSSFVRPFTITLPTWIGSSEAVAQDNEQSVVWEQADCTLPAKPCPNGSDLKLRVVSPVAVYRPNDAPLATPMPGYAAYLAYLRSLPANGLILSDEATTTVAGRPATLMTLVPTGPLYGAIGCENQYDASRDCWGLVPQGDAQHSYQLRIAVIDTGATPLLVWLRANRSNPNLAAVDAEFEQTLSTIRLAPGPSAASS